MTRRVPSRACAGRRSRDATALGSKAFRSNPDVWPAASRKTNCCWCPEPDSNRHGPFGPTDFKSVASTYSAIRAVHRNGTVTGWETVQRFATRNRPAKMIPAGFEDSYGLSCARISPPGCAALWTFTYRSPALYALYCASLNLVPAGTSKPSPLFLSGTTTGPFFPIAAS